MPGHDHHDYDHAGHDTVPADTNTTRRSFFSGRMRSTDFFNKIRQDRSLGD
jgi:hypothetical protein